MKNKKTEFEDFNINIKILLAGLWTSVMFLYIYGDYFELYVPGKVEGLISGKNLLNTPYKLLYATILLTVPSLMIFLSLILKPKINRILNISIAGFLALFTFFIGMISISEWRIFYVMLAFLESILTSVIVWKAWTWKRIS
ncbi:DUF6326 family protein [Cloacibacterium sp.]|uniref:DUF6326 family protein n=1 Tax=Cloacibacterium sp. TaxID=1913682 RepID=UPI0035B4A063